MTKPGLLAAVCLTVLIGLLPVTPGVAAAVPAVTAEAVSATVVEPTAPVGPEGTLRPGYKVVRNERGATCKSHSPVTGNAYSCHVRYGYDPCWLTAKHGYVVCLSSPYARKVTRLHVARFVNKGGLGKPASLPWGLLLSTGARTTLIPGKFGTAGGKAIHYTLDSRYKTVLVGPIDKSGPVWRIRKARNNGRFRFKITGWIDISKAWVGEPSQLH